MPPSQPRQIPALSSPFSSDLPRFPPNSPPGDASRCAEAQAMASRPLPALIHALHEPPRLSPLSLASN
ncbi:uncharacterized protein BDZ99DRAFT_467391 [Mytilinidion resinicola]|uniref:Uncharacterized protein n=1 Tax=Mytilinidion resinicola TaxID=574789 RepID=A0A6A6Y795_9PEZI|nr:uncharacterized protein BDZ99DRAFT_467391 [Mytilinidion resinicola]KAF2804711.1 hypothetical protein BDZ99DRAFT_467391 [Mytilinidion resinicola]